MPGKTISEVCKKVFLTPKLLPNDYEMRPKCWIWCQFKKRESFCLLQIDQTLNKRPFVCPTFAYSYFINPSNTRLVRITKGRKYVLYYLKLMKHNYIKLNEGTRNAFFHDLVQTYILIYHKTTTQNRKILL